MVKDQKVLWTEFDVRTQSNPGIPKEYAEHLMRDMTKILEDVGEGESATMIPDDPDTPLIISYHCQSRLKLKK